MGSRGSSPFTHRASPKPQSPILVPIGGGTGGSTHVTGMPSSVPRRTAKPRSGGPIAICSRVGPHSCRAALSSQLRVDTRTILRDHNGDPSDAFGNPHFATRSVLVVDYAIRAVDFDWETADPLAAARYLHEHAFPKVEVTWDPPIATERGIRMRGTIGGSRHLFPEIGIWLEALYGFPVAI
jgi:hypothetical protein